MKTFLALLSSFFAAAPGAIQAHLNVDEIFRIAVTALLAGGGVYGVLFAEVTHLPQIVKPADVSAATAVLAALSEIYRRLGHGAALPTLPAPPKTVPSQWKS